MSKFGWCVSGHHKECRVRQQRWYHGTKRVKRKTVEVIVYTDEYRECSCKCHLEEE